MIKSLFLLDLRIVYLQKTNWCLPLRLYLPNNLLNCNQINTGTCHQQTREYFQAFNLQYHWHLLNIIVDNLICRYSYNYVWMSQEVSNESLFMFEFKQRVKDCYIQEWTESVNEDSKLSLFKNLKIEITPELYLSSIRGRNLYR